MNSENVTEAINTREILEIRQGIGIVDWTKINIQKLDRKSRKLLAVYGVYHPKTDINWLYLKRDRGGEGLITVGGCELKKRNSLLGCI